MVKSAGSDGKALAGEKDPTYGYPRVDPGPTFSARDLLTVLFKRSRIMIAFFVVTVTAVGANVFLANPTYEVTAAILVKNRAGDASMAVAASRPADFRVTLEDLNSEIEILKNTELVERVARDVEPPETGRRPSLVSRAKAVVKRVLGFPQLTPVESRVLAIQENMDFWPVVGSHVLEISFKAEDPEYGTRILDRLIHHYFDLRLEVHQAPEAVTLLDAQTTAALERLTSAEDDLRSYVEEAGVAGRLDEELLMALERWDQMEAAFAEAHVALEEGRERVRTLRERLEAEPARIPSARQEDRNASADELSRALVNLRLRRDDLLTRGFAETNGRARDLQAQIELAERQLAEAEQDGIDRTQVNEVHQQIRADLLQSEAALDGGRGTLQHTSWRGRLGSGASRPADPRVCACRAPHTGSRVGRAILPPLPSEV